MKLTRVKPNKLAKQQEEFLVDLDKMPCYYANLEKSDKQKEWRWNVGCKVFGLGKDTEYSFKLSKIVDVENQKELARITGQVFAIELIDVFRDGGEAALKEWIKQGCI